MPRLGGHGSISRRDSGDRPASGPANSERIKPPSLYGGFLPWMRTRPTRSACPEATDPTAIVAVKSMLLPGFDAPVAQVLYLDRMIREAELLQAIARVNRTAAGKGFSCRCRGSSGGVLVG